jgi:hypothetical protein
MAKAKRKKIIQVPIEDVKRLRAKELDHQYSEGYRKKPESPAWAEASAKLPSKRLATEKW